MYGRWKGPAGGSRLGRRTRRPLGPPADQTPAPRCPLPVPVALHLAQRRGAAWRSSLSTCSRGTRSSEGGAPPSSLGGSCRCGRWWKRCARSSTSWDRGGAASRSAGSAVQAAMRGMQQGVTQAALPAARERPARPPCLPSPSTRPPSRTASRGAWCSRRSWALLCATWWWTS